MTSSPVVRANPKNLPRPGTGGSMQAAFMRGDQQPVAKSRVRRSNPRRKLEKKDAGDFWPAEPEFLEQDTDDNALQFMPPSRTVIRGSSITLTLKEAKAYDVEWRAYSPVDDEEQVVTDNGNRTIIDTPMHDTVYEVRFKTIGEKHNQKVGGPAMYTRGHRVAVYFTVANNPDEPSSSLRCTLEKTQASENIASSVFCVENIGKKASIEEILLAVDTDIESVYVEKEAQRILDKFFTDRRTCTNWTEQKNDAGTFVACIIDSLGPGEKCFVCYAAQSINDETKDVVPKLTRASVWSNFEVGAVAPVGCKNIIN